MTLYNFLDSLTNGRFDELFSRIYGNSDKELLRQRARYLNLAEKFSSLFPEHDDIHVYYVPMSTVICGNNAEKYHGCKLSMTLSSDICAMVGFRKENKVQVYINGDKVRNINNLILSEYGGFDAYILTDIPTDITSDEVMKMLCVAIEKQNTGGCIFTDFKDNENPLIRTIDCDSISGYSLCILDTGVAVSEINTDIKNILKALGVSSIREADEDTFFVSKMLREKCSDSEIVSAFRLYDEIKWANEECEALESGRFADFFHFVNMMPLPENDTVIMGVMICRRYLNGSGAAYANGRMIHAFVPTYRANDFTQKIESVYGEGSCYTANIRTEGAVEII